MKWDSVLSVNAEEARQEALPFHTNLTPDASLYITLALRLVENILTLSTLDFFFFKLGIAWEPSSAKCFHQSHKQKGIL